MIIKEVSIGLGATHNLGDFSSSRADVRLSAEVVDRSELVQVLESARICSLRHCNLHTRISIRVCMTVRMHLLATMTPNVPRVRLPNAALRQPKNSLRVNPRQPKRPQALTLILTCTTNAAALWLNWRRLTATTTASRRF